MTARILLLEWNFCTPHSNMNPSEVDFRRKAMIILLNSFPISLNSLDLLMDSVEIAAFKSKLILRM